MGKGTNLREGEEELVEQIKESCQKCYDLAQKVVLSDTSTREEINEFLRLRGIVNQCLLSLIDNPGEGKNDRLAFRGCAGCQYNGPIVKKFYS